MSGERDPWRWVDRAVDLVIAAVFLTAFGGAVAYAVIRLAHLIGGGT